MTVADKLKVQQGPQEEGIEIKTMAVADESGGSGDEADDCQFPGEQLQTSSRSCCGCGYDDVAMAKGIALLGTARGPIVMSNVFLSTAFIYLASEEVGCVEEIEGVMEVMEDCNERVYGVFQPAALITNIAVISGLLSAFLMPIAGAIIDYTSHRWTTGVVSAILITAIQIAQIGTTSNTWFPMAILQAIAGCLYQIQVLATWAYLSDVARQVTEETMTRFTSNFTMVQFSAQALFLFLVVAISMGLGTNDVGTGRISQAINALGIVVSFKLGWGLLPMVPARHKLDEGKNLIWQGFAQNWNTAKCINKDYKRSLRWFLLGVLFAEPAANAFTVVAVVFLNEQLKMSGNDIGIFFFVVFVAMVPGGLIFQGLTLRTNPNTAIRVSMFLMFILAVIGALVLTEDNVFPVAYIWGLGVGLVLGCFYPCQQLFYSLVVPQGQEAEFSGFYVYCSQLLVWLPPLVFSTMVEANVDQRIGMIAVASFFLVSIAIFSMAAPFDELLEEVRSHDNHRLSFGGPEEIPLDVLPDKVTNDDSVLVPTNDAVEDTPTNKEAGMAPTNNDETDGTPSDETSGTNDAQTDMKVKGELLLSGRLRIPAKSRERQTS